MKTIPESETPAGDLSRSFGKKRSFGSARFRLRNGFLLCAAFAAIAAGGLLARVSSQIDQSGVEITSPSGLREKPDGLANAPAGTDRRGDYSTEPIPDDIVYGQIFRHIAELGRKADSEERKGRDGRKFRDLYKEKARLTEGQARILDNIARDTNISIRQIDARARQLIAETRARTPNRRIEFGQTIPSPPTELTELSNRRRDLILKAIWDLRQAYGEAGFLNFGVFVDADVKPGIKRMNTQNGGLLR